jgi:ribosomal protein S18 acetylase RimI-like enzyme
VSLWRIRDFHDGDLDKLIRIWDESRTTDEAPLFSVAETVSALRTRNPALVAVVGEDVVGGVVCAVAGERAWVLRIALASAWRNRGIGSALLTALEHRLFAAGIEKICGLLPPDETGALAYANRGYVARERVVLFEKQAPLDRVEASALDALGGQILPSGLWERLAGMTHEKALIDGRVVAPLRYADLAARHGVRPARAIVLFGPPGTGKTTFARAIASRVGWPFVEVFPSSLQASRDGIGAGLRATFDALDDLDRVVVFIDEFEEIGAERTAGPANAVVNELLKLIPRFRQRDGRLLVCATNDVRTLDAALVRPGRFDYLLPIGPPDDEARLALWQHHLAAVPKGASFDYSALVVATENYTAADIEHAARAVAQRCFERARAESADSDAETEDVLAILQGSRPTVSPELAARFREDTELHARL